MTANPEQIFRTHKPDYTGMNVEEVTFATLTNLYGKPQDYQMDIITSQTVPSNGKTVMFIHGGGFSQPCDKRQAYICLFAKELCAQGYTVISPDYPILDDMSELHSASQERALEIFESSGRAANAAFDYVMDHAQQYGLKGGKMAIMGGSAGGMTAVYATSQHPERYGALVPLWGSPEPVPSLKDFPPTLCVHGTADEAVPIALEYAFQQALEEAGVSHQLITLEGCGHTPVHRIADYMPAISQLFQQADFAMKTE